MNTPFYVGLNKNKSAQVWDIARDFLPVSFQACGEFHTGSDDFRRALHKKPIS